MSIKANKLKVSDIPEKGKMYEVKDSCDILVEEKQENGSLDHVVMVYCMDDNRVGYFAKEYLPPDMPKAGAKRIDITAVMMNHEEKTVRWHLYDIKDTVTHEKTVYKLYNQWNAGLQYLKQNILYYLSEYISIPDMGVITRSYDEEGMRFLKNRYEKICEEIEKNQRGKSLAQQKKRTEIAKCRGILKAAQAILDGKFQTEMGDDTYDIHVRYLSNDENDHIYHMRFLV